MEHANKCQPTSERSRHIHPLILCTTSISVMLTRIPYILPSIKNVKLFLCPIITPLRSHLRPRSLIFTNASALCLRPPLHVLHSASNCLAANTQPPFGYNVSHIFHIAHFKLLSTYTTVCMHNEPRHNTTHLVIPCALSPS